MSENGAYRAISNFDASLPNWPVFFLKFQTYIEGKEMIYVIDSEDDIPMPGDSIHHKQLLEEQSKTQKKHDAIVRSYLINKIDPSVLGLIAELPTAYQMWRKLQDQFALSSAATRLTLINKLLDTRYRPGSDMATHLSSLVSVVNTIKSSESFDIEQLLNVATLRSIPEGSEWHSTFESLKTLDEESLTIDKVKRKAKDQYYADKKKSRNNFNYHKNDNAHEHEPDSGHYAFLALASSVSQAKDVTWYKDAGAVNHYTHQRALLFNYLKCKDVVYLADHS
ncbi:hypothetical protein HK100_004992, partial [Physocladia obscura]